MFDCVRKGDAVFLTSGEKYGRLTFLSASTVRVTYTQGRPFSTKQSRIVVCKGIFSDFEIIEEASAFLVTTSMLRVHIDKATASLRYSNAQGKVLLQEPAQGGKWLTRKEVTRTLFQKDAAIDIEQSIDGARAVAIEYTTVIDRQAFEAKLEFVFADDEALFGLGSHEGGYGNLRGRSRELYQQNMKAVVPCFVSTRGYGVLFDCESLMTFHDDVLGSYWWADVVEELDFYFIAGDSFDEVTRGYHVLTGAVPMLPKWAFGYVQSKERYVNAEEIIEIVREYRRRQIPLDVIVLDWKSWPNGEGWGQKFFDPARFPDPSAFVDKLHSLGAKLMVSIWPIMTGDCSDQHELLSQDLMLGNRSTYDAFQKEARAIYWEQARRGLFAHGVDAWWCDCTEPFEADWSGAVKPEPHVRLEINVGQSKRYLDAGEINSYSLLHSQGIYEGQRATHVNKRVINLTRSSYAGQHRYGTITWNGDICATWETLRRCIPEGLNFCATGEPFWTVDIGGFFVDHNPDLWFWRGDYPSGCRGLTDKDALVPDAGDTGCTDLGYWELYTRWMQYGALLPMMRSHGTDAAREIWRFGEEGSLFYDVIAKYIRLRYRLLPYIYSVAAAVTLRSESMMRALALAFPEDARTFDINDQYLFGPGLMVCPVTTPMYFGPRSQPLEHVVKQRLVYMPEGTVWVDFWTGSTYTGGQTFHVDAPLETVPLFVLAGSIVPMTEVMQYTDQAVDAPYELRVFAGKNGEFLMYEDAGDSYAYEKGEYSLVRMVWDETAQQLTLGERAGTFPTLVREREYHVVLIANLGRRTRSVCYKGEQLILSFMDS
jgi:alpha-D-xyloside xylohydrolase